LRRGVLQADVAALCPRAGDDAQFGLGRLQTVPADLLTNVRFEFILDVDRRGKVSAHRREPDDPLVGHAGLGPAVTAVLRGASKQRKSSGVLESWAGVREVIPMGARQHMDETAALGRPHRTTAVSRNLGPHFVLNLPLPIEFDARPHRCTTCQHAHDASDSEDAPLLLGTPSHKEPELASDSENELLEPSIAVSKQHSDSGGPRNYWTVSDDDIRREFPGAVVCNVARKKKLWITPTCLLELCQMFYEQFNGRGLKRQLAAYYSANAMAEQVLS
jgi:hypothetical protein